MPLTLPAHSTLFTGLLPPRHGVRDNGGYVLDPKHVTLARMLKDGGWKTGAFVGAFVLDGRWGLDQGFDTYFDEFDVAKYKTASSGNVARRANEVTDTALPWLEKNAQRIRFFAWIHYYDAHTPYDPPEPYRSRFQAAALCRRDRVCRFPDSAGCSSGWIPATSTSGRSSSPSATTAKA